jgi:Neuraminidase (sialidase)
MLAKPATFNPGPQVYCTFDPQSAYPTWQNSQKPPTGPGQARVAWSPDGKAAYCGTSSAGGGSHNQSAFSISKNNGSTWNQIGLIDL